MVALGSITDIISDYYFVSTLGLMLSGAFVLKSCKYSENSVIPHTPDYFFLRLVISSL